MSLTNMLMGEPVDDDNPLPVRITNAQVNLDVGTTNLQVTTGTNNPKFAITDPLPRGTNTVGSIANTSFGATQSGSWSVSVSNILPVSQSGSWTIANTVFGSTQSGAWNVSLNAGTNVIGSISNSTFGASQVGSWSIANTSFGATQVGTWTISNTGFALTSAIPAGTNTIGSISNTSFGIVGAIPEGANNIGYIKNTSFGLSSSIPTGANTIGSIANTAFASTQSGVWTVSVSDVPAIPAGTNTIGSIANTAFAINGSIPSGVNTIGSISNTTFAATQNGIWGVNINNMPALPTGNNTIGSIANTTFASTQSGTWNIANITGTISLPTGASTSALQTTANTSLATIATNTTAIATSAKQDTGNTSLASIDSKLSQLATGTVNMTTDEYRVRQGKGFTWSTLTVSVSVGNYLNIVFTNPTGSGKTVVIDTREFTQSSANVLRATSFSNPNAISGGTTVNGVNRLTGNATTAVAYITYAMSTSQLTTGTAGPQTFIPPNGEPKDNGAFRILPPGTSFGYSIGGSGGVLTAAASVIFNIIGWEE